MSDRDRIEFYVGDDVLQIVTSSMVPDVGDLINIRQMTYRVTFVSYSLDYPDDWACKHMRANVNLEESKND